MVGDVVYNLAHAQAYAKAMMDVVEAIRKIEDERAPRYPG